MFKIINNKKFEDLMEQLEVEKIKNKKIVSLLENYENENKRLDSIITTYKRRISLLENNVKATAEKIKKLYGSTGGLIKENNKLKKEIEELKSDRYLRKQIPEGKRPNTQKIKVSKAPNTKVQNYMKKELSNE